MSLVAGDWEVDSDGVYTMVSGRCLEILGYTPEEIIAGVNYQILYDDNKTVEQVLIPINDQLQLHIMQNGSSGGYTFEALPIISETKREAFVINIESSPYNDIIKATGSTKIAQIAPEVKNSLPLEVNFI